MSRMFENKSKLPNVLISISQLPQFLFMETKSPLMHFLNIFMEFFKSYNGISARHELENEQTKNTYVNVSWANKVVFRRLAPMIPCPTFPPTIHHFTSFEVVIANIYFIEVVCSWAIQANTG